MTKLRLKELCVQVCVKELCACVVYESVVSGSVYVFKFVCERSMFKRCVCVFKVVCSRGVCVCVKEVCVEVCVFASMSLSATPATHIEG